MSVGIYYGSMALGRFGEGQTAQLLCGLTKTEHDIRIDAFGGSVAKIKNGNRLNEIYSNQSARIVCNGKLMMDDVSVENTKRTVSISKKLRWLEKPFEYIYRNRWNFSAMSTHEGLYDSLQFNQRAHSIIYKSSSDVEDMRVLLGSLSSICQVEDGEEYDTFYFYCSNDFLLTNGWQSVYSGQSISPYDEAWSDQISWSFVPLLQNGFRYGSIGDLCISKAPPSEFQFFPYSERLVFNFGFRSGRNDELNEHFNSIVIENGKELYYCTEFDGGGEKIAVNNDVYAYRMFEFDDPTNVPSEFVYALNGNVDENQSRND